MEPGTAARITGEGPFQWLVGAFYQDVDRQYGQNLPTPATTRSPAARSALSPAHSSARRPTRLTTPICPTTSTSSRCSARRPTTSAAFALTAGLRYYDFEEDRLLTFAGFFADMGYTDQPGSTSSDGFSPRVILSFNPTENVQITAQASKASGSAASTIRSTSLCVRPPRIS